MKKYQPNFRSKSIRFIGVEGLDDEIFFSHLKNIYLNRNNLFSVKIHDTKGSSVERVIRKTAKYAKDNGYEEDRDEIICIVDSDREEWKTKKEELKILALNNGIKEIIALEPTCLECFLLKLLGKRSFPTCENCKSALYKLLSPNKRATFDNRFTSSHFPLELLEEQRKNNLLLDQLLNLFKD